MTRSVCNSASDTLDLLTRDLEPGERTEFRDRTGVHMTLYVERLPDVRAGSIFTVAHAHTGHLGELVCDPLVTLLRGPDGSWTPLEISTPFTHLATVELDPRRVVLRDEHRRLVKLTDVWMLNIRANLLRAHSSLQKEEMCSLVAYLAE